MKKILFVATVLFAILFSASCTTTSTTKISFVKLPDPFYYVVGTPELYKSEDVVKGEIAVQVITGGSTYIYRLNDSILTVTGLDFSTTGSKTLTVKFDTVSVMYTYQVVKKDEVVETYDDTWYTTNPTSLTFSISDAADLRGLAKLVNDNTTTFEGKTIELQNDIDLGNVAWTPIGEGDRETAASAGRLFKGTFDGKNHTISNLTNVGYIYLGEKIYTNSIGVEINGYCFGLFGRVQSATIKNLKIDKVNIFDDTVIENGVLMNAGDSVAAIVGYVLQGPSGTTFTIENCHVLSGNISSLDAVGGIVGRDYGRNGGSIYRNCTNAANISATLSASTGKAAGIAGFSSVGKFISCTNTGNITSKSITGGIVGTGDNIYYKDYVNTGILVGNPSLTGDLVGNNRPSQLLP